MMSTEKHKEEKTGNESREQAGEQNPDPSAETSASETPPTEGSFGNGGEDDTEQQVALVKEQLLRKAADFENYKKRTEAEIQNILRFANENMVLSVLPIMDDLERSLKLGKEADDVAAFHKGVELIRQKLQKVLESYGVTPLETAGKPFDVHYHDALMQVPNADVAPDTILEEVEKGYSMNGKVIRHAKVIVSSPPHEESQKSDSQQETGASDSKDRNA